MTKVDTEEIKQHRFTLWYISFVAALFNFVPLLNLFVSFFGEISIFHYFKSLQKNS